MLVNAEEKIRRALLAIAVDFASRRRRLLSASAAQGCHLQQTLRSRLGQRESI